MTFSNLGLETIFVDAVEKKGYTEPTPVQSKVIPWILKGKDILASAQTGTGKTAGFTLPLLQRLSKQNSYSYFWAISFMVLHITFLDTSIC